MTTKLPPPLEKATGIEPQPLPPTMAMSSRPSPLKSPATAAVAPVAQTGKSARYSFFRVNLPSPFEWAIGMDAQPLPPTSAMSSRPSPSKSPVTGLTVEPMLQPGKSGEGHVGGHESALFRRPGDGDAGQAAAVHERDVRSPVAVEIAETGVAPEYCAVVANEPAPTYAGKKVPSGIA